MSYDIIVNHITYRKGPTLKGKIACDKRGVARVHPEIKSTMDRLTNLYNFMVGSEIPRYNNVQSGNDYVVSLLPEYMKQPAISNGLMKESPKVDNRRVKVEFGISRCTEVWGRRRTRSTTFICRKGSSLAFSGNSWLSGHERNEKFLTLKNKISLNEKADNLSEIMSDPDFLIACWVKIRSNKGSMTPAFEDTLDGIKTNWFVNAAAGMRNGMFKFSPSRRTYVPKPNGKLRPLTMPSPKDKIVQEGMRFLLEMVFEPNFAESSYGFRPNKGCHSALKDIKKYCLAVSWYIEGDVEQQFPSIDHDVLMGILESRIKDQAFIDLIYKYLRVGYGEKPNDINPMRIGVVQGGILSPILSNIYMTPFDEWMRDDLIPRFTRGETRKRNPEYMKKRRLYYKGEVDTFRDIKSMLGDDQGWKRVYYFRYADDFIIGVDGNKSDCLEIKDEIKYFLVEKLKLILNEDKTKITHAEKESAKFLGYRIHKSPIGKMAIKRNSLGIMTRRTTRPLLDAPIDEIIKKLVDKGYAFKDNDKIGRYRPTRNGKFINLTLEAIIDHYKTVERGILNYYCLASNYGRLAAYVHYILKYSCVLTVCSKMKLKTMRRVFSKYGKNLSVKRTNGKFVSYLTPSYKKPRIGMNIQVYDEQYIDKLHNRISRGRSDLWGPCTICGSKEKIEIHHVRALRKNGSLVRKDFITKLMSRMNRKQIPVCKKCHLEIHKGKYDGPTFR
jgi:group II intron reverse transcriptase/maturase